MNGAVAFRTSRRCLIGGLIAAPASMGLLSAAERDPQGVTVEQFGAVADGRRDDARPFAAALRECGRTGAPLMLAPGAHYSIGSEGWHGLATLPGADIVILGQGATLHLKAVPSQTFAAGEGNALLRFTGGSATVRDVSFELGGLPAAAIEAFGTRVSIEGSRFANGAGGNRSFGLYLNRSSGLVSTNSGKRVGHFIYVGHTDAGQHSSRLEIANNRAVELSGDFVVGVLKDSVVRDNIADGMFSGVALAAFDRAGSRSENVTISGNSFANFAAHGVQSDVVGNIRLREIVVRNNSFRQGRAASSAGVYLIRVDGFDVEGNLVQGTTDGVVLDAVAKGSVRDTKLEGAGKARNGVMLAGDVGAVEDVIITGNEVIGYAVGIASGGSAKGGVRRVRIERNSLRNGGWGLRIVEPAIAINVVGNLLSGNRRGTIFASARGVTVGVN